MSTSKPLAPPQYHIKVKPVASERVGPLSLKHAWENTVVEVHSLVSNFHYKTNFVQSCTFRLLALLTVRSLCFLFLFALGEASPSSSIALSSSKGRSSLSSFLKGF